MKITAEKFSFIIRTMLLVICCTLFMPQSLQAGSSKSMDSGVIRATSMTLAITGINNPVSQIQNLASSENTALRGSGQRSVFNAAGKRTNFTSPTSKRHSHDWYSLDDDGDDSALLPGLPPLPDSFSLCTKEQFSFCVLPPESHGHLHWFALAPPASRNV